MPRMSRPTTRLGRGNLSDHIRSAWHKHFSSFDREAAFKDLKFGSFIGLTTIAVSLLAHLSGEEDLKEHPIAAIVLIFLFAAPIVLDVVWRIIKICRDLYQQRPQASFRDAIHFGIAMLFQVCLFSSIVMWSIYVSSPHFKLEFDEFRVGEMPVFSPSAVYVLFLNCNLKNTSEVQGTTRNWYLTVHTIDGGNIFGSEATIDPRDEYGERNFIPYSFEAESNKKRGIGFGADFFCYCARSPEYAITPRDTVHHYVR